MTYRMFTERYDSYSDSNGYRLFCSTEEKKRNVKLNSDVAILQMQPFDKKLGSMGMRDIFGYVTDIYSYGVKVVEKGKENDKHPIAHLFPWDVVYGMKKSGREVEHLQLIMMQAEYFNDYYIKVFYLGDSENPTYSYEYYVKGFFFKKFVWKASVREEEILNRKGFPVFSKAYEKIMLDYQKLHSH